MSLALNVIVGRGDEKKLEVLLASCNKCFDEFVIVDTGGNLFAVQTEESFKRLIKNHTILLNYSWNDNFSEARNKAIEHTTSDYIMWLDCDDIPPTPDEIYEIKGVLDTMKPDFVMMPYLVGDKGNNKYTYQLLRERIFKNNPKVRWHYPVHEQLDFSQTDNKYIIIENSCVKHDDKDKTDSGLKRNIRILYAEYAKGNHDQHIRYNLAKDIILANGDVIFARKLLEELINDHELNNDSMAFACNMIANSYAFQKGEFVPQAKADSLLYAYLCASCGDKMAEPHITIGDYAFADGEINKAIDCYKVASSKKPSSVVSDVASYGEVPIRRIAKVYESIDEVEMALFYNKKAMAFSKDNDLIEDRKTLLARLK